MHLGIPRKSDLKARSQKSILPIYNLRSIRKYGQPRTYLPVLIILLITNFIFTGSILPVFIFNLFSRNDTNSGYSFSKLSDQEFLGPKSSHNLFGKYEIPETTKFIFPLIQEAPHLQELTLDKLFKVETFLKNGKNTKLYSYSPDYFEDLDKGNEIKEKKTSTETPLELALKHFKSNGHRVYKGNENPEIVLVTGIDYERLDTTYLVKIVQNRVDYAHKNGFAVYSRWIQEFIPLLQEYNNDLTNWARIFIIREAMHAFPNAKYFWYIDENSFIMREDINIFDYIIDAKALDPIILKNQPIILPDGAVKTYQNSNAKEISLIITQDDKGLNTDSFIVKNDIYGIGLLEFWVDPLFRKYPSFRNDETNALSHILQWHPVLLSKTALIPPRTICALESENGANEQIAYKQGDLVISFRNCVAQHKCELLLKPYWTQSQNSE